MSLIKICICGTNLALRTLISITIAALYISVGTKCINKNIYRLYERKCNECGKIANSGSKKYIFGICSLNNELHQIQTTYSGV